MQYLPKKDQDLAAWALNFSTLITANPTAYGLTAGQATTFATLRTTFISALATATNNDTRTKVTVAAKNAARAAMLANARLLASIVQAAPTTTNAQRESLGLTVRDTGGSPIGPPSTAPIVTLLSSANARINFRYADELTPASRAKPFGAIGLQVFTKVGGTAPVDVSECTFAGQYSQNSSGSGSAAAQLVFDGSQAGQKAYVFGRWVTRRGDVGPLSPLVQMNIAA